MPHNLKQIGKKRERGKRYKWVHVSYIETSCLIVNSPYRIGKTSQCCMNMRYTIPILYTSTAVGADVDNLIEAGYRARAGRLLM